MRAMRSEETHLETNSNAFTWSFTHTGINKHRQRETREWREKKKSKNGEKNKFGSIKILTQTHERTIITEVRVYKSTLYTIDYDTEIRII